MFKQVELEKKNTGGLGVLLGVSREPRPRPNYVCSTGFFGEK